eukprot:CAMPEP_0170630462 /NCGR_PEP_ID=MMETSP0224-20130122/34012_1 /TAXON_ID=285029 /ORGANISM="Togula jolla, Strain CCCM 725" /LENGTH=107 /DNA_ID=CAMNT_0010958519 /DNA_START=74 /DNA_END=394 /DNA_ORIENTATION=-
MRYLKEDSTGHFVCMAGFECKAAGSGPGNDLRVQCTLHGKLRSLDCLQDDGTGRLVCCPERRCKTGGEPMNDYRDRRPEEALLPAGAMAPYGMPGPYGPYGYGGAPP